MIPIIVFYSSSKVVETVIVQSLETDGWFGNQTLEILTISIVGLYICLYSSTVQVITNILQGIDCWSDVHNIDNKLYKSTLINPYQYIPKTKRND